MSLMSGDQSLNPSAITVRGYFGKCQVIENCKAEIDLMK